MFNELRFVHALIEFGSYARHVASEAEEETRDTRVNLDTVPQFAGLLTQVCSGWQVAGWY